MMHGRMNLNMQLVTGLYDTNKKGVVVSGTVFGACTGEYRMRWKCGRHIISAWNSTIWNRWTDSSCDF